MILLRFLDTVLHGYFVARVLFKDHTQQIVVQRKTIFLKAVHTLPMMTCSMILGLWA